MTELTKTEVTQIIHTGVSEQSPVAAEYIDKVRERYGVDIAACYLQTSQLLRAKTPINPENAYLENNLLLTVYVRLPQCELDSLKKRYSGLLLECFLDVMSSHGEKIEYNRSYTPEEMDYYGWRGKNSSEWDEQKVIYPKGPVAESKDIMIESLDGLAVWHYLTGRLKAINRLPSADALSATVYCGWDKRTLRENLYVVLPESSPLDGDTDKKERFKREALGCLRSADKLGVFCEDDFEPIYAHWSDLPENVRFELLRG